MNKLLSILWQGALVCVSLSITQALVRPATGPKPIRIAVLDFGTEPTGTRVAQVLREQLSHANGIWLVDRDAAQAAARGAGYAGSLNLSLEEARNLGAAIGCDLFFVGDAQTLRRSPSTGPIYFESFSSIFLVSARTGRLVLWERRVAKAADPDAAEKALLAQLVSEAVARYQPVIQQSTVRESAERAERIEKRQPIIEIMPDDNAEAANGMRPPRPYRRLKPEYPETAAQSEVKAIVDVLVDVDEKGEVSHLEISRWAGYGLDESVIATVRQLHFFPAMREGRAIPMRVLLRYNFRKPSQ